MKFYLSKYSYIYFFGINKLNGNISTEVYLQSMFMQYITSILNLLFIDTTSTYSHFQNIFFSYLFFLFLSSIYMSIYHGRN